MDAPVGPSSRLDNDEDWEIDDDSEVVRMPQGRYERLVEELLWKNSDF